MPGNHNWEREKFLSNERNEEDVISTATPVFLENLWKFIYILLLMKCYWISINTNGRNRRAILKQGYEKWGRRRTGFRGWDKWVGKITIREFWRRIFSPKMFILSLNLVGIPNYVLIVGSETIISRCRLWKIFPWNKNVNGSNIEQHGTTYPQTTAKSCWAWVSRIMQHNFLIIYQTTSSTHNPSLYA